VGRAGGGVRPAPALAALTEAEGLEVDGFYELMI